LVAAGQFREDLFYRIHVLQVALPPLRERREDIPLLIPCFLAERYGDEAPEVVPEVLDLLLAREYPGNVRDLRQLVDRIVHRHVGKGPITLGDVPEEERPKGGEGPSSVDGFDGAIRLALARGLGLKEINNLAADTAVRIALAEEHGSLRRAAERLGVTDRALQMRRAAQRRDEA